MIIRIPLPSRDLYFWENSLVANVPSGTGVLQVLEKRSPPIPSYLIIGEPGNKQTELVAPASYSDGVIYLSDYLKQDHLQATNIYVTFFKNVEIYRTDENGKETLIKTVPIEWSKEYTIFDDSEIDTQHPNKSTYTYTFAYVNSQTGRVLEKRPAVVGDEEGYTTDDDSVTAEELIRQVRIEAIGNPTDEATLPTGRILLYLNETLSELVNDVVLHGDRQYYISQKDYNVLAGKSSYLLPEDFDEVLDVRLDGCTIGRKPIIKQDQTCNKCPEPKPTKEPIDPCACIVEEEPPQKVGFVCDVCFQDYRYSILSNTIVLMPTPDRDMLMTITYSGFPERFTLNSRGIRLPKGFREILILGTLWRYFFRDLTKRNAEGASIADRYYAVFQSQKRLLLEKMERRPMGRTPTQQRYIKGNYAFPYMMGLRRI